jgi:CRP-like cAMP-binding protein
MAFLIQANEGVKSVILPLGRALILIGRDPGSDLYLKDSSISKNHASIVFSDGAHILRDNGSTNGSLVNGTPVREHRLAHGDTIRFGPYSFMVDLVNPVPATSTAGESGITFERSGHSYSRSLRLPEIPGNEQGGVLHVVMSDKEKPKPTPLPPAGFLENLSERERRDLSARGDYHYARRGEILIREGQDAGRLFFLISGRLEARKGSTQTHLGTVSPGEWVGEVNIFDPAGAVCSVVATEPSEYWEITREGFERFINESKGTGSAILIALASTLGRRIRQSTGALQEAVVAPRRSRFTLPLAAAAALAILTAAWLFFAGASDKNRLREQNRQLEQESVETLTEARQRIETLQSDLAAAQSDLARTLVDKQNLAAELESARATAKVAQSAPPPRNATSQAPIENTPPQTPLPHSKGTLEEHADAGALPPRILVTQSTSVPALVDGRVSGRVAIPAGLELAVTGIDGDAVLVEFGNTPQRIPKARTNFAEAQAAEAKAADERAAAEPTPADAGFPPPVDDKPKPTASVPPAVDSKAIDDLVAKAGVLETLEELRPLRNASEQEASRVMRPIATKWNRLSSNAAQLLSSSSGSDAHMDLLKKFIEASEIADHKRLQLFESKLREIDASWIKLKASDKIQALTGSKHNSEK